MIFVFVNVSFSPFTQFIDPFKLCGDKHVHHPGLQFDNLDLVVYQCCIISVIVIAISLLNKNKQDLVVKGIKMYSERARIRTWNLLLRRQTRYPLRHAPDLLLASSWANQVTASRFCFTALDPTSPHSPAGGRGLFWKGHYLTRNL